MQTQLAGLFAITFAIDLVVFGVVAYVDARLGARIHQGPVGGLASAVMVAAPFVYAGIDLLMGTALTIYVIVVLADPLDRILDVTRRIVTGERPPVPGTERVDEIGALAKAVQGWEDATAARDVLLERAPVGIIQFDRSNTVLAANRAAHRILGYGDGHLVGRSVLRIVHPDDQVRATAVVDALLAGDYDRTAFEGQLASASGTATWCSVVIAPIAPEGRLADTFMVILEDIGERKRQAEAAGRIQRQLLPGRPPAIAGYDLAGDCLPASDVAGDLYDWVLTDDGRHLDLTLADVTGKGMGPALVMALLQTALRTAPQTLGPAARATGGDGFVTFDLAGADLFVRLFQARLELRTGELRYVDAGHGYCAIRRAGGEFTTLPERSLPLGALGGVGGPGGSAGVGGEDFREGRMKLDPGDTLIVHSDGLVEIADQGPAELRMYERDLERAEDAEDAVRRLLGRMPARLPDDVTLVVLRRLAAGKIGAVA